MITLSVILGIILFISYVGMMSVMIILERDKPKNIIIWSMVFLLSQVVGYIVYLIIRNVFYKKRNSLFVKHKEDKIYDGLIAKKLYDNKAEVSHNVFDFNNLAFKTKVTANNYIKFINNYSSLKESLMKDLENAKNYIILELTKINSNEFQEIKNILINKAQDENLMIKLVHDSRISHKLIKELKQAGVKVYRFSKFNTVGKVYSNLRNTISIDGVITYIANLNITDKQLEEGNDTVYSFLRLSGDIAQDINVQTHKDAIFASGKFIPYLEQNKPQISNKNYIQLVANNAKTELELAIINAICMAKKSIQMQLNAFIPTESIISLLNFAINSDIDVRLMVPLKTFAHSKYFASRAYAKQLALYGANVYLFDGYINSNAITIDDEYVIYGSYILDREHLNTSPQNMLFIKNEKIVEEFNNSFNVAIDNSYRINDAKFMLLREKFFKNFV